MAGDEVVNVLFTASGNGLAAHVGIAAYDPGDMIRIDREIRHSPAVVAAITKKANECLNLIEKSDDFRVIVSTGGESRARAYVAPRNNAGIHLELADSVLLKAAASMAGR
jgi:hypothetical protein